ncbi:hypothetical protein CMESO_234 (nucleomorph) [Chroomonas mesostigmatica CCMP1168]|uniref:Uncharacterized protein n=1 Tax=Chroomonas mesostigmatica CCMP1168 TaxID=1195612 RepID=J7G1P5_9CRYP|nr:hypothetical protein CMESO_234 [Chroomonas mesostigmatica CCMP1168]
MKKNDIIRCLFEKKLLKNSSNLDIWLTYIYFEIKNRFFKHFSHLVFRFFFRFKNKKKIISEILSLKSIKKKNFLFQLILNNHKLNLEKSRENLFDNLLQKQRKFLKNSFEKKKNKTFDCFNLIKFVKLEIKYGNIEHGIFLLENVIMNENVNFKWKAFFKIQNIFTYLKEHRKIKTLSKKKFLKIFWIENLKNFFFSDIHFFINIFFPYDDKNFGLGEKTAFSDLKKKNYFDFQMKFQNIAKGQNYYVIISDFINEKKNFKLKKKHFLMNYEKNLNFILLNSSNFYYLKKIEISLKIRNYNKIFFFLFCFTRFIVEFCQIKNFRLIFKESMIHRYLCMCNTHTLSINFIFYDNNFKKIKKQTNEF